MSLAFKVTSLAVSGSALCCSDISNASVLVITSHLNISPMFLGTQVSTAGPRIIGIVAF